MTLLCPKYVAASDYQAMDETADYAAEQLEPKPQPEEKGGEACPA
jgi:hypothetical protein